MVDFTKLGRGALSAMRAAKPVAEIDPLAAAVAARMSGQLEAMSPLMGLRGVNLPAAYAGDQRSMQAVTRQLNAIDNGGLQSPGRRKILKQGAATAARSMVPDSAANALGTTALKKAISDAVMPQEIPDASVQAAIAMQMDKFLGRHAAVLGDLGETGMGVDMLRMDLGSTPTLGKIKGFIKENGLGDVVNAKQLKALLDDATTYLSPEAVAASSQLPVGSIHQLIRKAQMSPEDLISNWGTERSILSNIKESSKRDQFTDYGFDEIPRSLQDNKEFSAALSRANEKLQADPGGSSYSEEYGKVYEMLYDAHSHNFLSPYRDLLGGHFGRLEDTHGGILGKPSDMAHEYVGTGLDNDYMYDTVDNMIVGVTKGYGK